MSAREKNVARMLQIVARPRRITKEGFYAASLTKSESIKGLDPINQH